MNRLQATIGKIENSTSLKELNQIRYAVNYPAFGWSEFDKAVLNQRISDAEFVLTETAK